MSRPKSASRKSEGGPLAPIMGGGGGFFLAAGLLLLTVPALAAGPAGVTKLGPVTISAGGGGELSGSALSLKGGVQLTSPNYDLQADHILVTLQQGGRKAGSPSIAKATAEGSPAKGTQVTGRFAQVDLARTYKVRGDHAVYTPDTSRPNGGRIDFTGHVALTTIAPEALDGPFLMNSDHLTVLLGAGPQFPKFEFGPSTATFTPLQ